MKLILDGIAWKDGLPGGEYPDSGVGSEPEREMGRDNAEDDSDAGEENVDVDGNGTDHSRISFNGAFSIVNILLYTSYFFYISLYALIFKIIC